MPFGGLVRPVYAIAVELGERSLGSEAPGDRQGPCNRRVPALSQQSACRAKGRDRCVNRSTKARAESQKPPEPGATGVVGAYTAGNQRMLSDCRRFTSPVHVPHYGRAC
jgi:hypothetical protein